MIATASGVANGDDRLMSAHGDSLRGAGLGSVAACLLPPPPLFLIQPLLARIMRDVVRKHPELLSRLGAHQKTHYLIDPTNLPFVLHLMPDPANPVLRACRRGEAPPHDARIAAGFFDLLRLIDCKDDGDAMFFSRDLDISGNTEAVVSLRNALDNIDGSLASLAADALGPPGHLALEILRRLSGHQPHKERSLP